MKRTLKDTTRTVVITIDNADREAVWGDGGTDVWTANVTVDGEDVLPEAELGIIPDMALRLLTEKLNESGKLNDLPEPVPERDKPLLLTLLKNIAATWGEGTDVPDWRDNEYLRGQLELVLETCRVITEQEYADRDWEGDELRDRVTTWIQTEVWK